MLGRPRAPYLAKTIKGKPRKGPVFKKRKKKIEEEEEEVAALVAGLAAEMSRPGQAEVMVPEDLEEVA